MPHPPTHSISLSVSDSQPVDIVFGGMRHEITANYDITHEGGVFSGYVNTIINEMSRYSLLLPKGENIDRGKNEDIHKLLSTTYQYLKFFIRLNENTHLDNEQTTQ